MSLLSLQQQLLREKPQPKIEDALPLTCFERSENTAYLQAGKELLSQGKAACLIVAGGQASRLHYDGPKGMFPISVVHKKTLFNIFCDKIRAASIYYGQELFVSIMTSPLNHDTTMNFFQENDYFGLSSNRVDFFSQECLPLLNNSGEAILEKTNRIVTAPNGNGKALHHLFDSGIWNKWKQNGTDYVNFIQVDNPLTDPFDPVILGMHHSSHNDISAKCILRNSPEEKLGVFVVIDGHVRVLEYSELPEGTFEKRSPNGTLLYRCGNISNFTFSMNFISSLIEKPMPLHLAYKNNAWKFEYFIFDVFTHSTREIKVMAYPTEDVYAPLKNAEGRDSIKSVQEALVSKDKRYFEKVSGTPAPKDPAFELPQEYYYS